MRSHLCARKLAQLGAEYDEPMPKATRKPPAITSPAFIERMAAKLVQALPVGDEWVYEPKLDGYACSPSRPVRRSVCCHGTTPDLTHDFPHIANAVARR